MDGCFRYAKNRGFSLMQVVAVLSVVAILAGVFILLPKTSWLSSSEGAVKEAEGFKKWFEEKVTRATGERRDFTLFGPVARLTDTLVVSWGEKQDAWRSKGAYFYRLRSASAQKAVFSWLHRTMTPAMTIEVRHSENENDPPDAYIVISGFAVVSISRTAP